MNSSLHWTAGLHHDGSALYVSNPLPRAGENVIIRLRTPAAAPIHAVYLRTTPDGEGHYDAMTRAAPEGTVVWWTATLQLTMPRVNYRFLVYSAEGLYFLNQLGVSRADGIDAYDFVLLADYAAPQWVSNRVFYQIFPDRFFNGDPALDVPDNAWSYPSSTGKTFWTRRANWNDLPRGYQEAGGIEFYNGDLPGITQKLDYLQALGVNGLYLNPIFTSVSNHRYNASDFFSVDPHLGGNTALIALREATAARDMRLLLDITTNHTGSQHAWFLDAQADPAAPTAEFFTFRQRPHDYESWLGHKSLPKLNYRSNGLRDIMYRAPHGVLRHWLAAPYNIDGWRLDVLNMTGNQGMDQLGHEIAREIRVAVKADKRDAYLVGEHFFDGTPNLQGDELDAVQNYQGFGMPVRHWLVGYLFEGPWDHLVDAPRLHMPAESVVAQMANFRAAVPWVIARQQFNQLNSHDIPRLLTLLKRDKALVRLAATLLMTYPGVPCLYYGDEVGLEGGDGEDKRRPMLWDETRWDHDLLAHHRRLIALRKTAPALLAGGYQTVYAGDGLLVYLRQSAEQRLLVVAYRGSAGSSNGSGTLSQAQIPVWHAGLADGVELHDLLGETVVRVENGMLMLRDVPHGAAFVFEG